MPLPLPFENSLLYFIIALKLSFINKNSIKSKKRKTLAVENTLTLFLPGMPHSENRVKKIQIMVNIMDIMTTKNEKSPTQKI
jgi:hypothetical protein